MKFLGVITFLATMFVTAAAALAAVADSDLQVAARAMSFLANPPAGPVRVGIVFDPANPQSAEDAAQLQRMMDGGFRVGNMTLQAVMTPINSIGNNRVALFFLTDGVAGAGRLGDVARAGQLPCITTDLAKVREGACAIGIRSRPRVEILVNHAAADASGVKFSTAFRMLITEF